MMLSPILQRLSGLILLCCVFVSTQAQLGFDLDIKKPEPYENRELKAEKTGTGKLKAPGRFFQNTYTHYNYFYNSNTKLNTILDRAKEAHRDNYAELLPFYNYSLDVTAQDSIQLDSVIHKVKTGIVLHDLRNDWIDNLYILWGASYYLQQQFDSAYQMFQFVNYSFAEKEKDGYYKYIGSRADGATTLSIATKEDQGFVKRMVSDPPSRNNALIWQIRTLTQQGIYPQAASLISTLKVDPNFPTRLHGALQEAEAYWFYKQNMWDSAAFHLTKALSEAKNKQELARWEYLAAQLFERKGLFDEAKTYYSKSINHTTDPVLDVYARLNLVRINKDDNADYVSKNIAELLKMAKRDKYEEYRDVIYAMAAQMEIERNNFAAAQLLLAKAARFKGANPAANNAAYLQLADLAFTRHDYFNAASYYDSIKVENLKTEDAERISIRRALLTRLTTYTSTIDRQDSMQRIANMPEAEREAFIKKKVRQLRRQQGLKEEETLSRPAASIDIPNPFASQQPKGEWYFYNATLKASGANTFKQLWGARPNVDNWRRYADVNAQLRRTMPNNTRGDGALTSIIDNNAPATYESLLGQLPLTPESLKFSSDSIRTSLQSLGNMYINELEDYPAAIKTFEELRSRFTEGFDESQLLFNLYHGYTKTGNTAKAAEIKTLLASKYPNSRFYSIVNTGVDPQSKKPRPEVTKAYEGVYDLFLEGKFAEAKAAKQVADSTYQTNYWSPQLLYIEAVHHIRLREDSVAQATLTTLVQQNAGTPIAIKAQNLMDVLSRRQQIEDELTRLQIERPKEDTLFVEPMHAAPKVEKTAIVTERPKDTTVAIAKVINAKPVVDTAIRKPVVTKPNSLFTYKPDAAHSVVVVLNKVDVVYVNEAKNAFHRYNKERYYNLPLEANLTPVNDDIKLIVISNFSNVQGALDYIEKTKPLAAREIVPWLKGDKFTFSLISEENLRVITETKDFAAYQKFLDQNLPVKF
jgi:hypothetical protein